MEILEESVLHIVWVLNYKSQYLHKKGLPVRAHEYRRCVIKNCYVEITEF